MKTLKYLFIAFLSLAVLSCNDDNNDMKAELPGSLEVMFENSFSNTDLNLSTTYTTPEGEEISFTRFEYILSNFRLIKEDGSEYAVPDSYYFMGQGAVNTNMREMLTFEDIPVGTYTGIKFAIGVDAATNTNTDKYEKGELQGGVGMDWGWNSGYKFINWEGTYFNTAENGQKDFKLHIGGDDNYKEISTSFGQAIRISNSTTSEVQFTVMAEKVFSGLSFNALGLNLGGGAFSGVMAGPADKATQIANQWTNMFMLHHVHNMEN